MPGRPYMENLASKLRNNPRLLLYMCIGFLVGIVVGCMVVSLLLGAVLKYSVLEN